MEFPVFSLEVPINRKSKERATMLFEVVPYREVIASNDNR